MCFFPADRGIAGQGPGPGPLDQSTRLILGCQKTCQVSTFALWVRFRTHNYTIQMGIPSEKALALGVCQKIVTLNTALCMQADAPGAKFVQCSRMQQPQQFE